MKETKFSPILKYNLLMFVTLAKFSISLLTLI